MQAYRGLPIITNQPVRPTRLVGIWPLDHEGSVAEYADLAHAAIDEILTSGRTPIVAGGTGSTCARRSPSSASPGAAAGRGSAGSSSTTKAGRTPRTRPWRPPTPTRQQPFTRTTAAGSCGRSSSRKRSLAPSAAGRLWTEEMRHPTLVAGLDVPAEEVARRIEERARAMAERGAADEAKRALAGPLDDGGQGDRARGVRDASDRRGRRGRRPPDAAVRRLPAQVAPPHSRRC